MLTTATVDWYAAQSAVERAAARVGRLMRDVSRPDAPAVGSWNVTEVAVHLSLALDAITAMADGGGGMLDDLWGLAGLMAALIEGEEERDLSRLAERIETTSVRMLEGMQRSADEGRTWLVRGTALSLSSLTCHALNELLVHGRDIALADGQGWDIPRFDANLIVNGFLFPALGALGASMLTEQAAGVSVAYDVRVRGGGRATFRIADGDFTVRPGPPAGKVDCHLLVEPEPFLLVAWGRVDQWRAIARGQLLAWGRRPWMGLKLRQLLRNP